MNIALVCGPLNSPTDKVMSCLVEPLEALGHVTSLVEVGKHPDWDYDIVHYAAYQMKNTNPLRGGLQSTNVWNVPVDKSALVPLRLRKYGYHLVTTDSSIVTMMLGQRGWTDVRRVPLAVDMSLFKPLPPPIGPFTVGVLGTDCPTKRWAVVEEACAKAGVVYKPFIYPTTRKDYQWDVVNDVYANVHCLVTASFHDTTSLVGQEALMCGRHVVTTRSEGMEALEAQGVKGITFFDGSIKNLTKVLVELKAADLSWAYNTDFHPPTPMAAAKAYLTAWEDYL